MNDLRKVVAPLVAATLLVAVVAALSFWTFRQTEVAADAHRRTFTLISRAEALVSDLTEAENGLRGFALTGDATFLEPYLAVRDDIRSGVEKMRPLIAIDAARKLLDDLAPLVDAKLAQMARVAELRRTDGTASVITLAAGSEGRTSMGEIRSRMQGFMQIETDALAQRDAALQSSLGNLFAVTVVASLLLLFLALGFAWLVYREARHRIRNLAHIETRNSLRIEEEVNAKLRHANLTLQISEEKLAVTLSSIGDAVITTDARGRVTLLNPLAERLTGWTRLEADGRPVDEIFHILNQETREPGAIPVKATLEKGTMQGLANHTLLVARDGSECSIADSCAPIRDRDGLVVGAVLVFRDVTAEYAVQQTLRDQQFYTRSLFDFSIDALMTTDPAGIITDVNRRMESLAGCTREALIGTPFANYFTDPARAAAVIASVLAENSVTDCELTVRAGDGREVDVSYNATTFYNQASQLQGVFAGARDVTERKRLDAELQARNLELQGARSAADKANLAKSDFLSNMSHELRTPLSAILGFAQLMESGLPEPTASQRRSIEQILKAGWYLLDLINEILDLALIESGKLSLSMEAISLGEVMLECRAMIEPQARKHGITVTFPHFELPTYVNADRTRVKQILINLLSNAIKYNIAHGAVTVDCFVVSSLRMRVSVTDTGAGLPPEKLAQLFQPFNRLGQQDSAEEGTGIGLVVAKRLVELMGGVISAASTVGKGSVFWIELNLAAEPRLAIDDDPTTVASPAHARAGEKPRTLLYVEDNPANLMLVEDLIARRPDLRLLSARDGVRGVEIALDARPDVILMDINLPGVSGIEALRILAAEPATAHIPVVALSANALPRDIEKGLEAGFFRYLTKPIRVADFMNTLDQALEFARTQAEPAITQGEAE